MADIGALSLIRLLAIGMPLGFASAFPAVATLLLKFGPDLLFRHFWRGPFLVPGQAVCRQMTANVPKSVPLFMVMAAMLG